MIACLYSLTLIVWLSRRSAGFADCFFFFFQAEDGIRDLTVTGVQTCALPIYRARPAPAAGVVRAPLRRPGAARAAGAISIGRRVPRYSHHGGRRNDPLPAASWGDDSHPPRRAPHPREGAPRARRDQDLAPPHALDLPLSRPCLASTAGAPAPCRAVPCPRLSIAHSVACASSASSPRLRSPVG